MNKSECLFEMNLSICMYIFICTYCTYMIVCVCIFQRHEYRYMQIRAYTYNTYTYVHTYRICTMCKCTYWIVFLVEYVTHFWNTNKIRTHTYNLVHWWHALQLWTDHSRPETIHSRRQHDFVWGQQSIMLAWITSALCAMY